MWPRLILLVAILCGGCAPALASADAPLAAEAAPATPTLAVTSVVPQPDASAVPYDAAIFVQFNKPAVPFSTLEHPAQDQPLAIEPPVNGSGHWITTGLYTFVPDPGWTGATTYHLSVKDTNYAWSFESVPAAVASTLPSPDATMVDPAAPITVTFNQPVDPSQVHVEVTPSVDGSTQWTDARTVVFQATGGGLRAGQAYTATVHLNGAQLNTWSFTTAPEPSVVRSVPQDGAEAPSQNRVELDFSAPMDPDDVRANLRISPELDSDPFPQWSKDFTQAALYGPFKPSTHYTLTLAAGTHDRFGRTLAQPFTLTFDAPAGQTSPSAPPVPPQAWLVSPGAVGTFDAYQHPRALLRTTNVGHFDWRVDAVDERALLPFYSGQLPPEQLALPDAAPILQGGVDVQYERNQPTQSTIDLGSLVPGVYRMRIDAPTKVADHVLVVTRSLLAMKQSGSQVLVWARDLQSGAPLAALPVRLLRSDAPAPIATGSTDADGIARFDGLSPATRGVQTVAVLDRPGDAAVAVSSWNGGLSAWSFGLVAQPPFATPPPVTAYIYADRPIYKPGQTVHLKGIVRGDDDAHYSLPSSDFKATWQVRDGQARIIASGDINELTPFGTFAADVPLSTEAAPGNYTFSLETSPTQTVGYTSITVAEYQPPQFAIALNAPKDVVSGDSIAASLQASYYFGQPLAGADVHWRITSQPFIFHWQLDPTFHFGDTDLAYPERVTPLSNASRTEGTGTTTAGGSLTFQVPTSLHADEGSQQFTLEATATDDQKSEVSQRTQIVVHNANLYIGLKPKTFVAQAGQPQTIEFVALNPQAQPQAGTGVHVQVVRRRWTSVRERDAQGELHWISRPQDTPVADLAATAADDGRGSFSFTPSDGGQYRFIAEAADVNGHTARSATDLWVSAPGVVPWRVADDGRLELQADKPEYQPGETAHVLVPAPVADATALISIERGKLLSQRVQHLSGNSTVLDIPIDGDDVPNVYVSVLLFGSGSSPSLWTGYTQLSVSTHERELQVRVQPDQTEHAPRDSVSYTVSTLDGNGHGVPAEISLALVDAAVLALSDAQLDPLLAFWHQRPLGVRTGSSLGVSIDRMNEAASSGRKGGGGGDSPSVRQDFPDTAFWSATVTTDATGVAHVQVHLPDSLTTWRMTVVAVTQDTRVGVGSADIVTSQPLLIRPLPPRFLVGGDRVSLRAAIHNTTTAPLEVTASLTADGLSITGDGMRAVGVPAGGALTAEWPVTVPRSVGGGEAILHFAASAGNLRDATDLHVPLLAWGASETVATAGEVAPGETATETLRVPKDVDSTRGQLDLQVTPSLAAALRYDLSQVEAYPYECLEQSVSRFLPRLALQHAVNGLGLADPLNIAAQLPDLVTRSIQRIYRFQHADGGWGFWTNDTSTTYLTAYAVFGLLEAQRDGFAVDQDVLKRGVVYLHGSLASPSAGGLDERAFVVYVLGESGAPEPGRASTLFDRRADLGPLGKAYLLQAMARIDANDPRTGGLLAELTDAAVLSATGSHWETSDASAKAWTMATDIRTTAAVLDALVHLQPNHPLVASTVRWLMSSQLSTTHETAQSLLALTDYLTVSGELGGAFQWQADLNGALLQSGAAEPATLASPPTDVNVPVPQLKVGMDNRLDLVRADGPGRLYYTLHLTTFGTDEDVPFVNQGLSVGREYLTFGASSAPVSDVHVGDVVQVRFTVIAPSDLHDVVLEDPLPAGLEPVDARLRTSSQALADAARAQQTPGWQPWSHLEVLNDRVAVFAGVLPKGTHQYTYLARAATPGEFHVLPANAHEQYFSEVFGRTDTQHFTVLP